MHHNALWRRVWDSRRLAVGLNRPLDHLPSVLPTKPPPRRCSPATSRSKFGDRTFFKVEPDKSILGPEDSEGSLTGLSPATFHETRCVPTFSHQLPDEFL